MGGPLDDAQRRVAALQASLGQAPAAAPSPLEPARPVPLGRVHEWPWTAAAGLVAASGVIHLVLSPEHMAEAQGQGLFFIALGVVQLILGLALVRHHARPPVRAAFVVTVASIAIYVLTRFLPQPFTDASEDIDATGVAAKAIELAALVALGLALARVPRPDGKAHAATATALALLTVGGLVLAGALYGLGLGLEAALPGLSEGSTHSHDDAHEHTAQAGHDVLRDAQAPRVPRGASG